MIKDIKNMAWNMFKTTGNVDTFLELKQIENIQDNISNFKKVEQNEAYKNQGNNNIRK